MSLSSFKVPYFKQGPILVQQDRMDSNTRAVIEKRMGGKILLFGQTMLGRVMIVRTEVSLINLGIPAQVQKEAKLYRAEDGTFVFMQVGGGPTLRLREIKGASNIDVPPKVWEELMAQLVVEAL